MIELPRSTFYYRSTSAVDGLSEDRLVELIGDVQDELPGYGYRRVTRELQRRGHVVNHKRIARVMKAHGLGIRPRRRFVRTTDSDHDLPIFQNLYRNVIPAKPDVVWVADITYINWCSSTTAVVTHLDSVGLDATADATSLRQGAPGWHRVCILSAGCSGLRDIGAAPHAKQVALCNPRYG